MTYHLRYHHLTLGAEHGVRSGWVGSFEEDGVTIHYDQFPADWSRDECLLQMERDVKKIDDIPALVAQKKSQHARNDAIRAVVKQQQAQFDEQRRVQGWPSLVWWIGVRVRTDSGELRIVYDYSVLWEKPEPMILVWFLGTRNCKPYPTKDLIPEIQR